MCSTSSAKCSSAISLLQEGYSLHQVQSKTSLGKSTIARIKKEMDWDKENSKGGRPSKLSSHNKQSIIHQITTGKLDNAVQATNFINNILPNPIHPQTVRNVLKENNFHSVIKKKCPLLKKQHRIRHLKFAQYHENWTVEDWKRVLWSDETKINRIGSDGRAYTWKQKGELLLDRTTTVTGSWEAASLYAAWTGVSSGTGLVIMIDSIVLIVLSDEWLDRRGIY